MPNIVGAQQIRIHTILKDPVYRKFFAKAPYLPPVSRSGYPWYVYIQREEDGKWARIKKAKYGDAYRWVAPQIGDLWDFAIVSRRRSFSPPAYRPKKHLIYWAEYPRYHLWCPYCRRPTIFRIFERHHSDILRRTFATASPNPRCTICGIREESVSQWTRLGHA